MDKLVKTVKSTQIWQSPDGNRTIWELVLEQDGQNFKAKTYSAAIASEGFEGEITTYQKEGKRGAETFVKQVPKEGGFQSSGSKDNDAIKAQFAIKAAVAYLAGSEEKNIEQVQALAIDFFDMVDTVKQGTSEKKLDEVIIVPDDEPLNLANIPDLS